MAATTHQGEVAACPFCGQPLIDHEAVRRVQQSERETARKIDAEARDKAELLAKSLVTKAQSESAKKQKALERDLAARETELSKLTGQHEQELERVRAKTESEGAKKIRGLERDATTQRAQVSKLKRQHGQELRRAKAEAVAKVKIDADRTAEKKVKGELLRYQRLAERERVEKEEAIRRIEHLTAEERGEFNEQELILRLKEAFPDDKIERVKRAHTGADLIHEVMVRTGGGLVSAGRIIYECKDTQNWQNSFVDQAKRAGQTHKTPYAIIISRAFPRKEKVLCVRDGVVVVQPSRVVDIARIMRRMVEEVNRASLTGDDEAAKSEELYRYLSSTEFRQAFDSIGECADRLIESLGKERKWHENTWVKRQSVYNELTSKTSAIDAELRAIIEKPKPLAEDLQRVVSLHSKGQG